MSRKKTGMKRFYVGATAAFALALVAASLSTGQSLTGSVSKYDCSKAPKITNSRWQNGNDAFDVNGDGRRTKQDADIVLAALNVAASNKLWKRNPSPATPPFTDVNGDQYESPSDALAVINYINNCKGKGEGEKSASNPWHNYNKSEDVNEDGFISPVDLLKLVNMYNANNGKTIKLDQSAAQQTANLVDINNDGSFSPVDINMVQSVLNAQ